MTRKLHIRCSYLHRFLRLFCYVQYRQLLRSATNTQQSAHVVARENRKKIDNSDKTKSIRELEKEYSLKSKKKHIERENKESENLAPTLLSTPVGGTLRYMLLLLLLLLVLLLLLRRRLCAPLLMLGCSCS